MTSLDKGKKILIDDIYIVNFLPFMGRKCTYYDGKDALLLLQFIYGINRNSIHHHCTKKAAFMCEIESLI